jgi:hypothetical protein
LRKTTQQSVPWSFLFPYPAPPRKKTIHNLPKNASPSRPPHHQCLTKGKTPCAVPIYESTVRISQRIRARVNKRPRVSAIKTTLLKALLPSRGNNDQGSPHQTQPDVCPHSGPGPPANPPQSGGQPTHLPHLPRTGMKKPTRRQDSQKP